MPQAAAEMVLLRLTYASDLPDPATLVKKLSSKEVSASLISAPSSPPNDATKSPTVAQATMTQTSSADASNNQAETMSENVSAAPQVKLKEQVSDVSDGALASLRDIVKSLETNGHMMLASQLYMSAHLVALKDGVIELRPTDTAPPRLTQDLSQALKAITGDRWVVTVSAKEGDATLSQIDEQAENKLRAEILKKPLVKNILKFFPDAELKDILTKDEVK